MVDKHINEEAFMTYLATKVSPAQLSAIFWCYGEIEMFFQRLHILNNFLFETTDMDTVTKIHKSIERNKIFKIKYKKQYSKIMTAWEHYYRYVKEGLYPKNEPGGSASVSTNNEAEVVLPELAKETQAEGAAGEQAIALEDRLHQALKNEAEQNKYGTTLLFLQQSVECKNTNTARSILLNAKWARLQYSRFFYIDEDPETVVEKSFDMPAEKTISEKSLATPEMQIKQESIPIKLESKEIYELLHDEDFRPLRVELARQNITTLEALRAIKLWSFMNRYNLYSIGKRQAILTKVQSLLNPEITFDDNQLYVLRIGSSLFKGATAAEAHLHFCEDMAGRYPLQFRTLIGVRMSDGDTIPILKSDDKCNLLKLENINAYISADLPAIVVLCYAQWISSMCGDKIVEVFIDEPQRHATESKPVSIPSPVTPGLSFAVQPVSEQPQTKKDNSKTHEIEQYILKADMDGMTYDDVKDAMDLTMVATRQLISEAVHIVDIKGRLIHEDAFVDWKEGADRMEAIVDKLIQKNNGYISCNQLYEYVRSEMNMFLNDNDVNEERAVYDIARHLFEKARYRGKHYRFYGKMHISRPEDTISSNFDIIKKYASEQDGIFSFTALSEYLESVGVGSGNLRAQMRLQYEPVFFYYDEGILMFSENIHIDEAWKASVKISLEVLFADVGDHIILREIPTSWFDRLPPLPGGRLWAPLLLQGILRFYSEELGAHTILAMEGQAIETLHTMLVSNGSPIQGFGDVVISYLVESEVAQRDFEAEELRGQLVNAGILKGNELSWNMSKALNNDERFAWDAAGGYVTVKVG